MSEGVRRGRVERRTGETDIQLEIDLDGTGRSDVRTGIGFFDHMLDAFARHGFFDLAVRAAGDLEVDAHHTVEDTGICLGKALGEALGGKEGLVRFGSAFVPMDESLVHAAIDLSGRPYLACTGFTFAAERVGGFPTELLEEFFRAVVYQAGLTLHLRCLAAGNAHHMIEAAFKAFARALDAAVSRDARLDGPLSTKGVLE